MSIFYGGIPQEDYIEPYSGVYFDGSFNIFVTNMVAGARGSSRKGVNSSVDWYIFFRDHFIGGRGSTSEGLIDVKIPGDSRLTKSLTNLGKFRLLELFFRNQLEPSLFRLILCTDNNNKGYRPSGDTTNILELKEIPTGNGYSRGGVPVYRSTSGFPLCSANNSLNEAVIQMQSVVFPAISGPIPKSGTPIYYAVLVDNSGAVLAYYDLSVDGLIIPEGISLALRNLRIKLVQ